jgi:hypothetical protein
LIDSPVSTCQLFELVTLEDEEPEKEDEVAVKLTGRLSNLAKLAMSDLRDKIAMPPPEDEGEHSCFSFSIHSFSIHVC